MPGWVRSKRRSRGAPRAAGLSLATLGSPRPEGVTGFLRVSPWTVARPASGGSRLPARERRAQRSRAPAPRSSGRRGSAALNSARIDLGPGCGQRDGKQLPVRFRETVNVPDPVPLPAGSVHCIRGLCGSRSASGARRTAFRTTVRTGTHVISTLQAQVSRAPLFASRAATVIND